MKLFFRKSILPLSINTYGILFIILTLACFSTIAGYSVLQINEIKKTSAQKTTLLARNEITDLIDKIQTDFNNTAVSLSNWEELQQQLDDPTYYAYWHSSRLPAATFLPPYFKNVELYNVEGIPLSSENVSILQLTRRLREENIYLNTEKNTAYQIKQIKKSDDTIKGFSIIEYDLSSILNKYNFQYINKKTITFNSGQETIELDTLKDNITYQINRNEAFDSLQSVMFNTIINLSIVGALISVTLWFMISFFSGKPLKILARHIDSIEYGDFKKLQLNLSQLQITKEYQTVRDSFNRFQDLLLENDSALKFSESRLQAVLENISIGIITFDDKMTIDSCNAEIINLFGYQTEELVSNSLDILFDSDARQVCHYQVEKLIKETNNSHQKIEPIEVSGVTYNGKMLELHLSINKIEFAGKHILLAIIRDISSDKRAHEKLEHLANYDALTSLPNRVLFQDRLLHATEQAKRKNTLVGLLFLDLDRFKIINDSLGHHIGDLLLIQAAKRIRKCIREGDTVARLGGDEFTIINEDSTSIEETIKVANRINEEIRKPFILDGQQHFISTSIGITFFPQDAANVDELIKHADAAMYKAKDQGGDTYQLFTKDISNSSNQRMVIETKLRHAIENQEFELFYQPRIDLNTKQVTSFEALIRWNSEGKYRAPPSEFIPILEDTGMIIPVGNWVLNEACIQINRWLQSDMAFNRIAINLSGRQFKHKNFLSDTDEILSRHNIQPDQIEFEITESLLIDNVDETRVILNNLHQRGFHISIDDFGTGYSSLAYLKQFPIDTIKIDQCFIKNYPDDKSDIAIVESIIAIAKNLDMSLTAEGIETVEQLEFLRNFGCHEAQGYYFARPMPSATVQTWIKKFDKETLKPLPLTSD